MGENTKYEDLSDFFVQYLSLGWYDVNHALTIIKKSKIWIPEFGGWASDYMDDICQPLGDTHCMHYPVHPNTWLLVR